MRLTPKQHEVVDAADNFLLLACPGSGKTRAAAERVSRLVTTTDTKVAICSYTNVGAERMGSVLLNDLDVILEARHFIGTLHSFLLQYVLRPFIQVFGVTNGVQISDDGIKDFAVNGDLKQRVKANAFRYEPDGTLVLPRKPQTVRGTEASITEQLSARVRDYKRNLLKSYGLVTSDDAMYLSLRLLTRHPEIAASVATRFDELLLDEAQDTSALQLACLRLLHESRRLKSLVLVGDLEQSIFSFQGASAEGCRTLAKDCGLDEIELSENHRCSQRICNVAALFCARAEPDTAVGPDKDCAIVPEVVLYPHREPESTIDIFRARLHVHEIGSDHAAVLGRRNATVDRLNGVVDIKELRERHLEVGQLAAQVAGGTIDVHGVRRAQRLIAYGAFDVDDLRMLDDEAAAAVRTASYQLLRRLPEPDGNVAELLIGARDALAELLADLVAKPAHTAGRLLPIPRASHDLDAAEIFTPPPPDLHAQTVHSVKGEDRDAIMVVIRKYHGSDPSPQLDLLEAAVGGTSVEPHREEERRVLFVALTRARRYCLVALPDDKRGTAVAAKCAGLGFELITA